MRIIVQLSIQIPIGGQHTTGDWTKLTNRLFKVGIRRYQRWRKPVVDLTHITPIKETKYCRGKFAVHTPFVPA